MPNPAFGCFYETAPSTSKGWPFFMVDWYACQIIEMIGADLPLFAEDFLNFLTTWEIYITATSSFAPTFNDRLTDSVHYMGSALMGDCIRILNLESHFPMTDMQTALLSAWEGQNYFRVFYSSQDHDLTYQFLGAHYYNKSLLIETLSSELRANITNFIADFFNTEGGASFDNNEDLGIQAKSVIYQYANAFSSMTDSAKIQAFWELFSHRSCNILTKLYYFDEYYMLNMSGNSFYFHHYDSYHYNAIASNYYMFSTLDRLGLMNTFYSVVGWQEYLKFEAWL